MEINSIVIQLLGIAASLGMMYGIMQTKLTNIKELLDLFREEQRTENKKIQEEDARRLQEMVKYMTDTTKIMTDNIKEDIQTLQKQQEKHNALVERLILVEKSSDKAHRRIDEIMKAGIQNGSKKEV